ncbi:MAG TPA: FAD:protein FMN transferase [Thermoanaerobaculia bacterium]|nr:FAD:protein FMN transferase [Thermoanaerobaculia bacterium]
MRLATILLVALATLPTTAAQRARYLMGTVCEVAIDGPDAEERIERAFAEAKRVEEMLSTWTEDSELARVNRGAEPSAELRALLERVVEFSRRTNGAFDPRMGELVAGNRPSPWPSPRGAGRGDWEEGAFGKGYAIDKMMERVECGDASRRFPTEDSGDLCRRTPHFIDFGGQLAVRGAMRVTIADPKDRAKPILELTLENASLSTSSHSEKSHIFDPRTRQLLPARGSVSVIAPDALTADILSTALYVMGEDEGLRWANAHRVAAIFITPANHIRRSAHAPDVRVVDRNFALKD